MYCYQCQETAGNAGCTVRGVCGKTDETARLQDLLVHVLKGLAIYGEKAKDGGMWEKKYGRFTAQALFATITNANFDNDRLVSLIEEGLKLRNELKERCGGDAGDLHDSALWFSNDVA